MKTINTEKAVKNLQRDSKGHFIKGHTGMTGATNPMYGKTKLQKLVVAFDVDGTLINAENEANISMVNLLRIFATRLVNVEIIVWSRGGADYASLWVHRLGLSDLAIKTADKLDSDVIKVDIAFDDEKDFNLAVKNIIVTKVSKKEGQVVTRNGGN